LSSGEQEAFMALTTGANDAQTGTGHQKGNRRLHRKEGDDIWVELCAMIFLDGLPETQAELVQQVATWLEAQGKPVPDDSTIKKKIRPLWQRLRPGAGRQAHSLGA